MSGIRPIIEGAVADVLAEHPKYFTERGMEKAQAALVRKIMAALRGDAPDKAATETPAALDEPEAPKHPLAVEPTSREGRAYSNLCALSGALAPFRMGDGKFSLPVEANCPAVMALADLPPKSDWLFLTEHKQIGAWTEFFRQSLPMAARRPITEKRGDATGILMPWPWPPSVTGKIYTVEHEAAE